MGGNITSVSGTGYLWEEGPSSFQPNDAMLKAAVSPAGSAKSADEANFMPEKKHTCVPCAINGCLWEEGLSSFQPNDAMLKAAACPCSCPSGTQLDISVSAASSEGPESDCKAA